MSSDALGAHAYARLRFDDVSERAVSQLARALQWHRGSAFEGQFIAQGEPRAGASTLASRRRGAREARDDATRSREGDDARE